MNKEEIRYCINIATLDGKLPYKKLLKEMKKEHLVDMCYELLKEHLALLDIKEEINNIDKVGYTLRNWKIVRTGILHIVNKALGSDNNE